MWHRPQDNGRTSPTAPPWVWRLYDCTRRLDRLGWLRPLLRPCYRLCVSPRVAIARAAHPALLRVPSRGGLR